MPSSVFGSKLNPYSRLREPLGVKAVRQSVVVTSNPAPVDQNQQLLVRLPSLGGGGGGGGHDVVVPGPRGWLSQFC